MVKEIRITKCQHTRERLPSWGRTTKAITWFKNEKYWRKRLLDKHGGSRWHKEILYTRVCGAERKKPPCSKRNCYQNVITIIKADPGAWRQAIVMKVEFRWSILRHVRTAPHNSTCKARDRQRLDHEHWLPRNLQLRLWYHLRPSRGILRIRCKQYSH